MITITCDICGKEITGHDETGMFNDFQLCGKCFKRIEGRRAEWREAKRKLFQKMFGNEQPAKPELPCVHVEDVKPSARVGKCKVALCGKGLKHVHVVKKDKVKKDRQGRKPEADSRFKLFVTTKELADELQCNVHSLQCYALRHDLGVVNEKKRTKVFNFNEAEKIREHFRRGR